MEPFQVANFNEIFHLNKKVVTVADAVNVSQKTYVFRFRCGKSFLTWYMAAIEATAAINLLQLHHFI